jgi:hypothetical protein
MPRELTYQLSYERLTRLSRSAARNAYRTVWVLTWLLLSLFGAALVLLIFYGDVLSGWLDAAGIPAGAELLFLAVALLFFLGSWLLRRFRVRQVKGRANFNQIIRMQQDGGGLRFMTDEVEHYLKWQGISQMLLERDGVVVSHGNLFFLVPDIAFASPGDRLAFIREVYGHLSEAARSLSDRHVGAALTMGSAESV